MTETWCPWPRSPAHSLDISRPVELTSGGNWMISSRICMAASSVLAHQKIPEDQRIHARSEKTFDRLIRPADDWLVVVERGVEHHRHARELLERFDDLPVA